MKDRLPLSALLSQVLVAFIIEFDNEAERQMPHRTTSHGRTPGSPHAPWLVSLSMWENCMRFVGDEGVIVGALEELARAKTNLDGMKRWGYIVLEPKPKRRDWVIRATPAGRKAQEIWRPLFGVIEKRWMTRFGNEEIDTLKDALAALVEKFREQCGVELLNCLPILNYGLFTQGVELKRRAQAELGLEDGSGLALSGLLSRVLLAFALVFERQSELSLAISANVMRILNEDGVRTRDLPRLSGVSKEIIRVSLGFLYKRGYVSVAVEPKSKSKLVRLTAKGVRARAEYFRHVAEIEKRWEEQFRTETVRKVRKALEKLMAQPGEQGSRLFEGLRLHPEGWRESLPPREQLPHFPMITHRGGFPDGS